jgi:hypothetical protein
MSVEIASNHSRRIGIARATLSGATTLGILFVVCWIGARLPLITVSHMFVQLFTTQPMTSTGALLEGTLWSVVFGGLFAFVAASTYNLMGAWDR